MGEKDIAQKTLLSYNDVFADIVNVLLFAGEQVVQKDELTDAQPFSQYKAADGGLREQERDVAKYWKKGKICLSLFGFENQTKNDSAMPLRVIGYDGAAYREQAHEKKSSRSPVITLVLYFGTEKPWDKPKSLKDSLEIDERLLPFFQDYGINVFNLAWLTDSEIKAFKSDFKIVAEYLRAVRVGEAQDWERQKIEYVEEICDLLKAVSNDDIFDSMKDFIIETQLKKGGFQMSEFVQKMISRGEQRGIALGEQRGIALGEQRGIALGRSEGENNAMQLISKLFAAGRADDVQRAANDREYFKKLQAEFSQ